VTGPRLYALWILSWAFLTMLLKKVFRCGPRGLALFRQNYEVERLSSLSPSERAELAGYGLCIACGRCNVGDAARISESRGAYPGTMALMLASSRSLPDFAAANEALRFVSDEDLRAKEGVCPANVPMRKVAAFIRNHA
jgi:succinate dehydrogenase/fumarate reductase-like Fe-S protein